MFGVGVGVSGCPGARTSLFDGVVFVISSFMSLGAFAGLLLFWFAAPSCHADLLPGFCSAVALLSCMAAISVLIARAKKDSSDRVPSSNVRKNLSGGVDFLSCRSSRLPVMQMFSSRGGRMLRLLLILVCMHSASAVCPHCKDTIPGCAGGDRCPTISDIAANAKVIADRTVTGMLKVNALVPAEVAAHFPRGVVDAILGLVCAPSAGSEVDFTQAPYVDSAQAVVQAALLGHCSVPVAGAELALRQEQATTAIEVAKLQGALDSLKMAGDAVTTTTQGVLAFIWAKVSNIISKRNDGVVKLEVGSSSKAKASAISVTMARPSFEWMFFEMLHLFAYMITVLGIAKPVIVMRFLDDVVYGALRMGESWKCSFELLLLYLKEIDRDAALTMANVFRRGGQDTLLAEARRNAAAFFRTRAGNALAGDDDEKTDVKPKPTGSFNKKSKQCCVDFNMGRPCRRLDEQGNCLFNHKCNQYVSDKGPKGVCFGDHARCHGCDYDESKKLKQPATQ